MGLICPCCKSELVKKNLADIELDYCENGCRGIWFDEDEFKKIKHITDDSTLKEIEGEFIPKTLKDAINEDIGMCPLCKVKLSRYNYGNTTNIFIDYCFACSGLWLDYGELKGIKDYQLTHSSLKEETHNQTNQFAVSLKELID